MRSAPPEALVWTAQPVIAAPQSLVWTGSTAPDDLDQQEKTVPLGVAALMVQQGQADPPAPVVPTRHLSQMLQHLRLLLLDLHL